MRDGGSDTFGFSWGEPRACARLQLGLAPFGAQLAHHRDFFPSDGSPKVGCFSWQPSHFFFLTFSVPACAFAQPEHQRAFPSAGNPKLGTFS